MELTDAINTGDSDEKVVLRRKLKADRCYVIDRGYAQFALFNDISRVASSYVCRMKENSVYEVSQERELSGAARDAGVKRDVIVRMGMHSKPNARPDHPLRLVMISITPHVRRGGARGKFAGPANQGTLVLATNLLDVPAEIIALIYQYRWSIEVFFRFFKQILGCRHLLSTKPPGVLIQMYCAIIACLLINFWTGARPTKRTVEMLAFYFMGVASEDEVLRHIAGLKKQNACHAGSIFDSIARALMLRASGRCLSLKSMHHIGNLPTPLATRYQQSISRTVLRMSLFLPQMTLSSHS